MRKSRTLIFILLLLNFICFACTQPASESFEFEVDQKNISEVLNVINSLFERSFEKCFRSVDRPASLKVFCFDGKRSSNEITQSALCLYGNNGGKTTRVRYTTFYVGPLREGGLQGHNIPEEIYLVAKAKFESLISKLSDKKFPIQRIDLKSQFERFRNDDSKFCSP